MNHVLMLWEQAKVVARQGVYYRDGRARTLVEPDDPADCPVRLGEPIDVSALLAEDSECTTSVDVVFVEVTVPGSALVLRGGECGHGSEGYFALLEPDRSLRWTAFFEDSNPFVAIDCHENVATIRSSNGYRVSVRTDTLEFTPELPAE